MLTSAKVRELLHPNWAVAPEERPQLRHLLALQVVEEVPGEHHVELLAWYRSLLELRRSHPELTHGPIDPAVPDSSPWALAMASARGDN